MDSSPASPTDLDFLINACPFAIIAEHCRWHDPANRDARGRIFSLLSITTDLIRQLQVRNALDADIEHVNERFAGKSGYAVAELRGQGPRILHSELVNKSTARADCCVAHSLTSRLSI